MEIETEIRRFLRRTQMPATTFGKRAVNDGHLVADLRRGRALGAGVRARVARFIAEHRA